MNNTVGPCFKVIFLYKKNLRVPWTVYGTHQIKLHAVHAKHYPNVSLVLSPYMCQFGCLLCQFSLCHENYLHTKWLK